MQSQSHPYASDNIRYFSQTHTNSSTLPFAALPIAELNMLPYILQQQQQLIYHANGSLPPLTSDETRDMLITIHHMCQDIKDSLRTLNNRVGDLYGEITMLRERTSNIESHTGIRRFDDAATEADDENAYGDENDIILEKETLSCTEE
ncbi:6741_t:CDS:1 [Paraglomus brasilianum]|uniref:6741_t:CDS:1 n=1 Tax=Paraglomus brasilianum TaxID=144538 RepID=A0A9N8VKP5_9GLOM|nr:6741_t:CDS:1 [Paraglomus brasilianum]